MTTPSDLPESFSPLRDLAWQEITVGKSGCQVWRITLGDGNTVFLKAERRNHTEELPGEIERLNWLTGMGFKAPRVVDAEQSSERTWLLMTAVPGDDLTKFQGDPEAFVRIYAQGLKRIHALDPTNCPFDHSIEDRLALAKARVDAGVVDESDFDTERMGWTAQQVLDWLYANPVAVGSAIVTHGDPCTPNILELDGRFSGMVDCGRVGKADVWQDLALACRSIRDNIGEAHVASFLKAYGVEWNEQKYRYFTTLDELF